MARRVPVALAAARRLSITSRCSGKSPWEKLIRAMFMPARSIFSITSRDRDAGPMVQTILVLFGGRAIAGLF